MQLIVLDGGADLTGLLIKTDSQARNLERPIYIQIVNIRKGNYEIIRFKQENIMETPTIISIVALILSAVALWQTHFAKFKILCTVGNLHVQRRGDTAVCQDKIARERIRLRVGRKG